MSFVDFMITTSLAVIMLGIGISLRKEDFIKIFRHPAALILGLTLQMIFLPCIFIAVMTMVPIPPVYKVGLILVSLCPGGSTSNFISYLVKADVALSVTLTSINSFLILLTLPIIFGWCLEHFLSGTSTLSLPISKTILNVLIIIILPTLIGMWLRHKYEQKALKLEKKLRIANIILFASVYSIKFFAPTTSGGSGLMKDDFTTLFPIALSLHLATMSMAYIAARLYGLKKERQVTISIEVGLQNTTLALLIATSILQNETMGKPALVFAAFSFFTTALFSWSIFRLSLKNTS